MGDKGEEGAEIDLGCKRPFPIQNDKDERWGRGPEPMTWKEHMKKKKLRNHLIQKPSLQDMMEVSGQNL